MKQFTRRSIFCWVLALATIAHADSSGPFIGYIYPAGGQQGTTFMVTLGGEYLDYVTNVCFSGTGVQSRFIDQNLPGFVQKGDNMMSKTWPIWVAQMRSKMPQMSEGEKKDFAALKKEMEIKTMQDQLIHSYPPLKEWVTLQVTIAADAAPGVREVRLETSKGLTNPRIFCVGALPEITKTSLAFTRRESAWLPDHTLPPEAETNLTLPVVVNGQIFCGDAHRFRFTAKKGQHLLITANARDLITYLADGVPGWFQPRLTLFDAQGQEITYVSHNHFQPDPVMFFDVPATGEYVLELRDSLYRGRFDFVYRLTVGELPYVTSIFPLGGPAGAATTIKLTGWNLPTDSLTLDNRNAGAGILPVYVKQGPCYFNTLPFQVDTLRECQGTSSNHTPATAQPVTLPIIINGRIEQPGKWDFFRFEGQAGQQIVAEVMARRLNSPLDSVIMLTDASGKKIAFNDDFTDKCYGQIFEQVDSYFRTTLPASGTYYLQLGDVQRHGGPEYAYRLRLSPPRPDVALRVTPSSIYGRPGAAVPITVHAFRKDGFTNEITLSLKDAPPGFKLNGEKIPALPDLGTNLNQVITNLTLTVPNQPIPFPANLVMEGRSQILGQPFAHTCVPAEDMMQAFFWRHIVPVQETKVAVIRGEPQRILGRLPVQIPLGGTARVRVQTGLKKLDCQLWKYPFTFAQATDANWLTSTNYGAIFVQILDPTDHFVDPSTRVTEEGKKKYEVALAAKKEIEGLSVSKYLITGEGIDFVLQSNAALTNPDLKGKLQVVIMVPYKGLLLPVEYFPLIPFEIVGKKGP